MIRVEGGRMVLGGMVHGIIRKTMWDIGLIGYQLRLLRAVCR